MIQTAHNKATIPIKATKLSPENRLLKSNIVQLNTIIAAANTITT